MPKNQKFLDKDIQEMFEKIMDSVQYYVDRDSSGYSEINNDVIRAIVEYVVSKSRQ